MVRKVGKTPRRFEKVLFNVEGMVVRKTPWILALKVLVQALALLNVGELKGMEIFKDVVDALEEVFSIIVN